MSPLPTRSASCLVAVIGAAGLLTGCSPDLLIWGPGGAQVIATTDRLVADVVATGDSAMLCADARFDLGPADEWLGLTAGEPERYTGRYWRDQAALDPQWTINLQGQPPGTEPGDDFPAQVFLRETADGLCVIGLERATLAGVG